MDDLDRRVRLERNIMKKCIECGKNFKPKAPQADRCDKCYEFHFNELLGNKR